LARGIVFTVILGEAV